jgi:hypothetical protein
MAPTLDKLSLDGKHLTGDEQAFNVASVNRSFPTGALDEKPAIAPACDGFSYESGKGTADKDLLMNMIDGDTDNSWRATWQTRIQAQHAGYLQIYMSRAEGWARKYVVLRGKSMLYFTTDHKAVLTTGEGSDLQATMPQGGFSLPKSLVLTQTG